ncbi:MAG: thymidine kinase [Anaerolineae bacterium]|nr:thymidine kinase [Anaerolineae bacterium]
MSTPISNPSDPRLSQPGRGWLEVICGGMFSGKTEELLRRLRHVKHARLSHMIFTPKADTRYDSERVVSHVGTKLEAQPVQNIHDVLATVGRRPDLQVIAIDEIQFLENDPEETVRACQQLADQGIRVIVAGLDQDFRAQPFPPIPQLMAVAEYVDKLMAICTRCGNYAGRSQRLIDGRAAPFDAPTIAVGGEELYEPRCRCCYEWPDD